MKILVRMCLFPLLIVAVLSWVATAQVDRSSLGGTVTDPSGGRISGATVTAIQSATGLERKTETSSQGTYMLDSLPIGRYDVTFSKPGFSQARFEQVVLGVGEARVLNVQLHIAAVAETITVTAPLVRLDTASAVIGAPVEQAALQGLPLNGRNWASLATLTPGAVDTGPGDQHTVRFTGHARGDNQFLFDGIDSGGIYNAEQKEQVRLAIPLDSVSEFQVQSQNFGADIGMTSGAQISAASRSGTNNFHGSLFDYYRSDVFDSRSPFDGASPSPFLLNQFGGALGGPIVSNRTFFYANYEGLRQRLGQVQIGLVPSPSFVTQIEAQSPALTPIISAYPHGTSPTSNSQVYNYVVGANQVDNEDSGMIRIDHRFTDRTTAFLRYSADETRYDIPTGVLNAMSDADSQLKNGVVELMHVFSPLLTNEAKLGVNQVINHTITVSGTPYTLSVSNLSSMTGASTSDTQCTSFNYVDDLSWMKGRHFLKFGVTVRRVNMNNGSSASGTLTYTSLNNFLIDKLDSATYKASMPLKRARKTEVFAYAMDQYRLTPKLTIDMGLHYSFFNVFHEAQGRAIPFDFATCGGWCPAGSLWSYPRRADLEPRVGIAWAPGKTVLRAGGGIYYTDGELDDVNWPESNDVANYTLSSVTAPALSYPIDTFLQNTTGIITPRAYDRNHKDMYTASWTASVERSLPSNIVGTVSYLGDKGTHLIMATYTNAVDPLTGVQPYPQFGVTQWRGNVGNSTFHALQMNVRRAFQNGMLLAANYMWSHAINDGPIGGGDGSGPQNLFCRSCEKASSPYDVRHVFNASSVYELPFGVGKHLLAQPGVGRAILGGWQLSGIATARTGFPVNVTINRSNSALPDKYAVSGVERPDLVPGVSLIPAGGQTPNNWINAAAFVTPASGTFGDAGRNLVRAPGLWQMDMALTKKIPLRDRFGVEFRAEAFNVFNRAQFGVPQAVLSTPLTFGVITTPVNQFATGSGTPRQFQFALRFTF